MFEEIKISRYRGIKNLKVDDFKRFNLFVGENNCGKTTVLEGIFLLINPRNAILPVYTNRYRKIEVINEDMWKILFYRLNTDLPIELYGKLKKNREIRALNILPKTELEINAKTEKDLYDKSMADVIYQSGAKPIINGLTLESVFTKQNYKPKPYKNEIFMVKTEQGLALKVEPPYKDEEQLKGVLINPFDPYVLPQVAKRFENILILKRKDRVIKILKKIESGIKDLSLGLEYTIYCDIGLDKMIPINALGAGILRLLNVILAVENYENGIVLIDEVENGLYPLSQDIVWDIIFRSAKEFNVQIFATTHSIECIKAFSSRFSRLTKKDDELRLFRMEKKDGEPRIAKFNYKSLETSLESEWDVR